MCEEFGCLPAQAVEAIENDVGFLLFKIMDFRAYAKAKDAYEQGQKDPDFRNKPRNALVDKVSEITFEIAREEIQRRIEAAKRALQGD